MGCATLCALGAPPLAPLPKVPAEAAPAAPASAVAPPQVVAAASAAVASLGDEVVLGRYHVAVERMNPQWKARVAKSMGGMDALEKQLEGVAQQMVQQGVSMISFKPQGAPPQSYEVSPGKKVEKVNGQDVESLIYNQWLVLIPTVTKFRIIRENDKPLVIESTGFQVAISDKAKNEWTFIDGGGLSVNDLRSVFATLPADMKLPPVGKREVK